MDFEEKEKASSSAKRKARDEDEGDEDGAAAAAATTTPERSQGKKDDAVSTGSDGPGKEEKDDTIPASAFDLEADREKFKKGTLKREAYEMLEKHWPELKDTNELWEQGLKENRCLGTVSYTHLTLPTILLV